MWYLWFIVASDCFIPVIMIITGWFMWKHCPKTINGAIGYRTRRSMKNINTWKFAHEYVGKLWWKLGLGSVISAVLIHIPFYGADEDTLGILSIVVIVIEVIIMLGSIIPVEMALKRNFNDDGSRR